MNTSTFISIISNNFERIKKNFQTGLKTNGYEFDEDLFIDTLLRCSCTLKDKQMTEKEAAKYYWVSYINSLKRVKSNPLEFDIEEYDIDDPEEEYNEDIDGLYNYIILSVESKFGTDISNAWREHICHGKTYKELEMMGYKMKFNYEFKRITRFIRNHLVKHRIFIEFMSNVRDDVKINI